MSKPFPKTLVELRARIAGLPSAVRNDALMSIAYVLYVVEDDDGQMSVDAHKECDNDSLDAIVNIMHELLPTE